MPCFELYLCACVVFRPHPEDPSSTIAVADWVKHLHTDTMLELLSILMHAGLDMYDDPSHTFEDQDLIKQDSHAQDGWDMPTCKT